jgi:hypothetical protein
LALTFWRRFTVALARATGWLQLVSIGSTGALRAAKDDLPTRASSGSGSSFLPAARRPSFEPEATSPSASDSCAALSVVVTATSNDDE